MAARKTTPTAVPPTPTQESATDAMADLRASLQSVSTTLSGVNLRRYRGETRDRVRSLRDETKSLLASL